MAPLTETLSTQPLTGVHASSQAPAALARRRRSRRRWQLLMLAVVLLAGVGAGWYAWISAQTPQTAAVTAMVERGDIEDNITALGNLQPRDYVDVGTQVSGQLKTLYFEIGAVVEKGALLAEIDPTIYVAKVEADRAQLLNQRAQLADKQAQLTLAQQQYRRQSNLAQANATSRDAYESAEAAQRSAAAQVEALKAQIQQTESTLKGDEANLSYTKIYAPMSGTIVSQTARRGQTLNASQQAPIIYRIADLSTMTVWTQVSEADVPRLRIGMDAYFTTLGRPDRRWTGTLAQILPTPDVVNNVVLYNALFDVPNPTQELLTQMSAQVFFISAAARNVPLVPVSVLRPMGKNRDGSASQRFVVKVVRADGSTEDRHITVGVMNRVSAEVKSGLEPGETVIIGTRPRAAQPSGAPARPPRLS